MKFRKKPVVVEAIHWDGYKVEDMPEWLSAALDANIGEPGSICRVGKAIEIYTLEGMMTAAPGDWIIRGVNGELYPCKPDIFEKTYEPAE